ncbi:hypothetical protein [Deinococcus ficus]|uniref:hypothetical protein n=1 Tax=Deinococcus ficus TaxID=317577 RepID=UPI00174C7FAF|nr:hypothetical protein [Deinococcus ficus]GHF78546.1 hypothetical protein GCM10017782_15630 [Deinococcus ficus]
MSELRLTFVLSDHDLETLEFTRDTVAKLANALLKRARRAPTREAEELAEDLEGFGGLPASVRGMVVRQVTEARSWSRGGLKMDGYWLDARSLKVYSQAEVVSLWTARGRLELPVRLGNYQRHRLRTGARSGGGMITRGRGGEWYVRLTLQDADPRDPGSACPDVTSKLDQLERDGQFRALAEELEVMPGRSARQEGQLMLALLECGETDRAELLALRAAGAADPRVHLVRSLLAGRRREAPARVSFARDGLKAGPDEFTRWWLRCSEARGLVETGQPAAAAELIGAVLQDIPVSELRCRARALYFAQGIHAALDDFEAQERHAREALRLYDLLGIRSEGLALKLDLAYRLYFQDQERESLALISEVVKVAGQDQDQRIVVAHLILGELHLLSARVDQAERHLAQMREEQQRYSTDRHSMVAAALENEILWRAGKRDWQSFARQVERLRTVTEFDEVTRSFYLGLLDVQEQRPSAARARFAQVVQGVALLDGFRLRALAFLAWLDWQQGVPAAAAAAPLLAALASVGGERVLHLDMDLIRPLYAACAEAGVGGRQLPQLKGRARPVLAVRTMGQFEVRLNGQLVHLRLSKSRSLLTYLAVHGPSTRDELITALWDGQARSELVSYFKQALLAIREALDDQLPPGESAVVFRGGRYQLHAGLELHLDLRALQRPLGDLGQADLQPALLTYGGPFLPDAQEEWAATLRDSLDAAAANLAMVLGQHLEATQPLAAAEAYLQATRINPLLESAWAAAELAFRKARLPQLAEQLDREFQQVVGFSREGG